MTDSEKIASLEARLLDVTARLDQIDNKKQVGFYEVPENDFDPRIPLAQEVSSSFTQSAKRTDVQVSWSNPDPGRIERFELWAENVTGQSKEPYLVASVDNSPASFSLEADQDTAVSVFIRTITRDGLSSTLRGSPAIGVSIVQQPLGASDIADGSIGDSKLDRVTDPIVIDTADIANLAVGNAQINDLAATKITAGTLDVGVLLASSIAATQINAGTLGAGVILASNILATQISAGTMSAVNVSAGTYTLTSGSNTMSIDSTGFKQTFGTTARTTIIGGEITVENIANSAQARVGRFAFELDNSSGNEIFNVGGVTSGQANSGGLALRNSSGTDRINQGVSSGDRGRIDMKNSSGTIVVTIQGDSNLGETNSGYIAVDDSAGATRAEIGIDSSGEGLIKATGDTNSYVQAVVGGNSAIIQGSSTAANNGLYVNGNQVVGARGTDPGASPTTEQLRQVLLGHGLI